EAARGRARVRGRADRSLRRARAFARGGAGPARQAVRRARARSRASAALDDCPDNRVERRRQPPRARRGGRLAEPGAGLVDVDFPLARPGPELGPEGYVRAGARHGLVLDPTRYEAARDAALVDLHRHPELEHDDEIWFRFTERIVRGMGGEADSAYACAVEITRGWENHANFDLYDDVLPTFAALRGADLRIGLVSNSARDVREFAVHHALDVDAGISSFHHGRSKPHASIFRAVLDLLEVEPAEAAMVGDQVADDIEGARALGMRAVLVDRDGLHPDFEPRITGLAELLPQLRLQP